jgi:hypothetical protein
LQADSAAAPRHGKSLGNSRGYAALQHFWLG